MSSAYQITATVQDLKPKTSRVFLVEPKTTFLQLHRYLQQLFGLEDYHMRLFQPAPKTFGHGLFEIRIPDDEDDYLGDGFDEVIDPKKISVEGIFKRGIEKLEYRYDFGADQLFSVKLEKVTMMEGFSPPLLIKATGLMLVEDINPGELQMFLHRYETGDKKSVSENFGSRKELEKRIQPALEQKNREEFVFEK